MGLFTLFASLVSTINDTIKESNKRQRETKVYNSYEDLDFANIDSVTIVNTEMTYRIETEEEFDPVMTNFLTDMDGWQHYETKTVEYEVENGYEYTFLIHYTNGKSISRTYHESHPTAQRLLEIEEESNLFTELEDSINEVNEILNDTTQWGSPFDYNEVASKFSQMAKLYNLQENPTEQELIEATRLKTTSMLMSNRKEYLESIQELLFFILAESEKDNDDFNISNIRDFMFTQNTAKGVDAFAILDVYEDVTDDIVIAYERRRGFNKFRKVLIATFGNNKAKIQYDDVIVWDMKILITAYMKAFKKAAVSSIQPQIKSQPKENFVVIDFETTGTNYNYNSPDMDEILSVSIINQDGEELLHTLCNTERKKSWYGAQRIHGISPQDVQGKPTFSQILPQVLEILSSVDFVIAYNIIFEYNFVKSYIKRSNPIYSVDYHINWAMHKDPMHMYAEYIGSRKWFKLSEAAKSFGYNFNPHDSLEDVKATLFLYNQLK